MSTPTAVAGYPSKLDATIALAAQGLKAKDIAARIGSTEGSVYEMLRKHRKQAAGEQAKPAKPKASKPAAAPQPGIWTPEKIDKARRLFGKTMIYIAEALQVPADELLHLCARRQDTAHGQGPADRHAAQPARGTAAGSAGTNARPPLMLAAPPTSSNAPDKPAVADAAGGNSAAPASLSQANADAEATALREAMPAPSAEAESVSRLAAGRTADEGEAVAGLDASPSTLPPPSSLPRAEMPMAATVQQRFRLRDETGQYLHEHERGMTRLAKFVWRGTEAQIASLMRKKPHLRQLEREECL